MRDLLPCREKADRRERGHRTKPYLGLARTGLLLSAFWRGMGAAVLAALLCAVSPSADAAEEWVRYYNGTGNGNDQAVGIAADTNGNVFVTGYSFGAGSGTDFATVKYSADGAPLWTNRY